jgi:hypothetical protein
MRHGGTDTLFFVGVNAAMMARRVSTTASDFSLPDRSSK